MRTSRRLWVLLVGLLAACATSSPSIEEVSSAPEVVASWEEGCEDERSLVLLCQEEGEECGLFHCREVVPREEAVLLASRGGGPFYIPGTSPFSRRGWGRPIGWPRGTRPVLTFRFNRHFDPKPPQLFTLPPGRWVQHHLFPQALRDWFHHQGVPDIHQFTILIPEHVHLRIHGRGPKGGLWNQAWRDFMDARPDARPEEIYRHAGELIFRFELTGPILPYHRGGKVR